MGKDKISYEETKEKIKKDFELAKKIEDCKKHNCDREEIGYSCINRETYYSLYTN